MADAAEICHGQGRGGALSQREVNQQLVETFFQGVNNHDPEMVVSVLADDCEIHDEGAPHPYDRDGLYDTHTQFYEHFPDARFDVLHRIIEENGACYIYHASGTGVGEWPEGNVLDGCRLDLLEMLIAYVDGDKICKLEFHMDTTILNEQIWGS
jgi:predicted ester cyclase